MAKKVAKSVRIRKSSRLNKGNGPFVDLPLDVLLEILKLVHPLGLLYLSRTNKSFRNFLLDRSTAQPIWRASLELADEAPPKCPLHTCEVQWTRILFEESCHACISAFDPIWWEFGARYCSGCRSSEVVKRLPKQLMQHNRSGVLRHLPRCEGYYLKKYITKFMEVNTEEDEQAFMQELQEQKNIGSDYARLGRPWMRRIVETRKAALSTLKEARLQFVVAKLQDAGWPERLLREHMYFLSTHDLLQNLELPHDEVWDNVDSKQFVAELENKVRDTVMCRRFYALRQAFPNLAELTKCLAIPPTLVDVALMPEVRAIIDADLKVELTTAAVRAAIGPKLPQLLEAWSRTFESNLRDRVRAALGLPANVDPLKHPLAYFVCEKHCCHGYFTGRREPCPNFREGKRQTKPGTYQERVMDDLRRRPTSLENMFILKLGRAVLEDVIKRFGKDPYNTTCEEMDKSPGKLYCMRCIEVNQPTGWRDAVAHSIKFHEKVSSLRPRWEVELLTEE
ncbi:hypothetical protein GGX14DRAFT_438024 [Mycena pura]|uniref:F-box domain-containing protein n=1 Tax=Mycena pura TaxID=153505 RepID=A0AAD6YFT4_9AGAR|nr:hypothetical protein GGX14DRAFT_438024 [Mycena pura]